MTERGPVIAALIFYKQTPERLHRCITSLAGRCQGFVALDGPYKGLSDHAVSPESNYLALYEAAAEADLAHAIWNGRVWSGEPQKRTAAAREAHILGEQLGADPWLLVLDSDEWVLSDIDWSVVTTHGSAILHNYKKGEPAPGTSGDGAKMVRLYPNTPDLMWGPAHYDVRDIGKPFTYSGWEKALANTDTPALTLGHDLDPKLIAAEYDAYNDGLRIQAEGKMMRIVSDYTKGDEIILRMDRETVLAGDWQPGVVVQMGAALVGEAGDGHCVVSELVPVAGIDALDIHMTKVGEDKARTLSEVNARQVFAERDERDQLLHRRALKRARQHDLRSRRFR